MKRQFLFALFLSVSGSAFGAPSLPANTCVAHQAIQIRVDELQRSSAQRAISSYLTHLGAEQLAEGVFLGVPEIAGGKSVTGVMVTPVNSGLLLLLVPGSPACLDNSKYSPSDVETFVSDTIAALNRNPQLAPLVLSPMVLVPERVPKHLPNASDSPARQSDLSVMNSFRVGVTTEADARTVLGEPNIVDRNPDGRFIYMYEFAPPGKDRITAAMVFGSDNKLIKVNFYGSR